jgi:hypothetical protein
MKGAINCSPHGQSVDCRTPAACICAQGCHAVAVFDFPNFVLVHWKSFVGRPPGQGLVKREHQSAMFGFTSG